MYENMTDEELENELDKQYGGDWTIKELNPDDPIAKEFLHRLETGVN